MEKLKLTIIFLIFAYCLGATRAECNIGVRNGFPIFLKTIGNKNLVIPSNQKFFTLENGEKILAHCSSGISIQTDNGNDIDGTLVKAVSISIECDRNGYGSFYKVLDPKISPYSSNSENPSMTFFISCIQGNKQLFESYTVLEGCTSFSSLGIGTVLRRNEEMVFAGVCFDFDTFKTKFVKYLAHSPKNHFVFESKNSSSADFITNLDKPLQSLKIFFKDLDALSNSFIYEQRENPLLALHKYEFVNIIQDDRISAEIQNFTYMLKTVWWQNLRLGSWKYFLDALHKRTAEVEYLIYIGTSGKLTIPSATNCKENEYMRINNIIDVPEIIWTYVKPVKANKNDEFVVFAYNTPFYSADNETISCKDVCNEIDWLDNENFKKIRLLPTFGVMHCCRVSEIASQLDVFPVNTRDSISSITELPLYDDY